MVDAKFLEEERIERGLVVKGGLYIRAPQYIRQYLKENADLTKGLSQSLFVENALVKIYDIDVPKTREHVIENFNKKINGRGKKRKKY